MTKYMKAYMILFIIVCIPMYSWSQSFELSETEIYASGKIGDRIEIPISIKNLTEEPLSIVLQRTENNIGNGQASFICWNKDCAENTSLHKRIEAKKIVNHIVASFESGLAGGYSTVKYLIFNRQNPQDAVELTIHYTIEEQVFNEDIYISKIIKVIDVYPNPVFDFLYLNYHMTDLNADVKVGIHNVLGSIVKEYQLDPLEAKAKIPTSDLNSGVYFYSLNINNEAVLIKKFVVRK